VIAVGLTINEYLGSQVLDIGVIGYRGHASRLIDLVNSSGFASVKRVFHPDKKLAIENITNDFESLLELDSIIIASPNNTHYHYLAKFAASRYRGYILCEKPPVTNVSDYEKLKKLDLNWDYVQFNFNYRFSDLAKSISRALSENWLGQPLQITVLSTHGLAFKDEYKSSWRAKKETHLNGIIETKSIHWIDLFIGNFGKPIVLYQDAILMSGNGGTPDTSRLLLKFPDGLLVSITSSYAAPLQTTCTIVGTDGILDYENGKIRIYHPRDTFDGNGRFVHPPCIYEKSFADHDELWRDSLRSSVMRFLHVAKAGNTFPKEEYRQSLASAQFLTSSTDS
jgi:predicted dehydrogenase